MLKHKKVWDVIFTYCITIDNPKGKLLTKEEVIHLASKEFDDQGIKAKNCESIEALLNNSNDEY